MYMFILIIYAYISENSILIFSTLSKSLSYVSIDSYVDTLLGIFILNSVHSPISLSTHTLPSCKFTSDLTNDKPIPVPSFMILLLSFNLTYFLNILSILSLDIPIPLSLTFIFTNSSS